MGTSSNAALPRGWQVGGPYREDERGAWEQYAWLPSGSAHGGRPKQEWIAVGATEAECVAEMARRLPELEQGRQST